MILETSIVFNDFTLPLFDSFSVSHDRQTITGIDYTGCMAGTFSFHLSLLIYSFIYCVLSIYLSIYLAFLSNLYNNLILSYLISFSLILSILFCSILIQSNPIQSIHPSIYVCLCVQQTQPSRHSKSIHIGLVINLDDSFLDLLTRLHHNLCRISLQEPGFLRPRCLQLVQDFYFRQSTNRVGRTTLEAKAWTSGCCPD